MSAYDKQIFTFEMGEFMIYHSLIEDNVGLVFNFLQTNYVYMDNISLINNQAMGHDSAKINDIYYFNGDINQINQFFAKNCLFSTFTEGVSIYIKGLINITFDNNTVKGASIDINFEEIGVFLLDILNFTINNNHFSNFFGNAIKSSQSQNTTLTIHISNSYFSENKAFYGSSLLVNALYTHLNIINTTFTNNSAITDRKATQQSGIGGVIFFECLSSDILNKISINSSEFLNNSASYIAPTIYSSCSVSDDISNIYILNHDFFGFTSQFFSYPISLQVIGFTSSDNTSDGVYTIASGNPFNISFELHDIYNQRLSFDSDTVLTAKINSQTNKYSSDVKIEKNVAISSFGLVSFQQMVIKAASNQTIELYINGYFMAKTTTILYKSLLSTNLYINIRSCRPGEIILNDETCEICKPGTYSFDDPMITEQKFQKCDNCMSNAICLGGSLVYPLIGYYKLERNSTYMIPCLNDLACLGYDNNSLCDEFCMEDMLIHGVCEIGNYGVLCYYCEKYYGKYENSQKCQQCADLGTLIIMRLVCMILIVIAYVLLNSFSAEKYNTYKEGEGHVDKQQAMERFNMFFKILVNHSQQVALVLLPEITAYSSSFENYLKVFDYFSMGNTQIITNECIIQYFYYNPQQNHVYKLFGTTFIPIIFAIFTFFSWLIYHVIRKQSLEDIKKKLLLAKFTLFLVLCTFLFYSLILKTSLALFQCIHLDVNNNTVYLKESPEIECWNPGSMHILIVVFLGIPCIVIWGIAFPYFLYKVLKFNQKEILKQLATQRTVEGQIKLTVDIEKSKKSNKNEISTKKTSTNKVTKIKINKVSLQTKGMEWGVYIKAFSFFYRGFRSRYFYWECVIFARKFLLSLFSALNGTIPDEIAVVCNVMILFIFLLLHLKHKPYKVGVANRLETFSLRRLGV